eukprot:5951662-Amphidinium_carterae.2
MFFKVGAVALGLPDLPMPLLARQGLGQKKDKRGSGRLLIATAHVSAMSLSVHLLVCFSDAQREALGSWAHTVLRPVPSYAVSYLVVEAKTACGVTGLGTLGLVHL